MIKVFRGFSDTRSESDFVATYRHSKFGAELGKAGPLVSGMFDLGITNQT